MADVVLQVPVATPEEADRFGAYLTSFMEARLAQASPDSDAPFLMVRSSMEPCGEVKVVIFQEPETAQAFSRGWRARGTDGAA